MPTPNQVKDDFTDNVLHAAGWDAAGRTATNGATVPDEKNGRLECYIGAGSSSNSTYSTIPRAETFTAAGVYECEIGGLPADGAAAAAALYDASNGSHALILGMKTGTAYAEVAVQQNGSAGQSYWVWTTSTSYQVQAVLPDGRRAAKLRIGPTSDGKLVAQVVATDGTAYGVAAGTLPTGFDPASYKVSNQAKGVFAKPTTVWFDNVNGGGGNGALATDAAPPPALTDLFTSRQAGAWSNPATWQRSDGSTATVAPGKGHRALVAHTVTAAAGDQIGGSLPDSDPTFALDVTPSGDLVLSDGAAFRVRGRLRVQSSNEQSTAWLTFQGTSALLFDASEAAAPQTTHYEGTVNTTGSGRRKIVAEAGSTPRLGSVRQAGAVTLLPGEGTGYFTVGQDVYHGTPLDWSACAAGIIEDLGTSTIDAFKFAGRYDCVTKPWNTVIRRCGRIGPPGVVPNDGNVIHFNNTTVIDGLAPTDLYLSSVNGDLETRGGLILFENSAFAGRVEIGLLWGMRFRDVDLLGGFTCSASSSTAAEWTRVFYKIADYDQGGAYCRLIQDEYRLGGLHTGNQKLMYVFNSVSRAGGDGRARRVGSFTEPGTPDGGVADGEYAVQSDPVAGTADDPAGMDHEFCINGAHPNGTGSEWFENHGDVAHHYHTFRHCSGAFNAFGILVGHSGTGNVNKDRARIFDCLLAGQAGADPAGQTLLITRNGSTPLTDMLLPQYVHHNGAYVYGPGVLGAGKYPISGYGHDTEAATIAAQGNPGAGDVRGQDPQFQAGPGVPTQLFPKWALSIGILPNGTHAERTVAALRAIAVRRLSPAAAHPAYPTGHPDYVAGASRAAALAYAFWAWTPTNTAYATAASDGTAMGAVPMAAPPPPTVNAGVWAQASQAEGNSGTKTFTLTLTRTAANGGDLSLASSLRATVRGKVTSGNPAQASDFAGGAFPQGPVSWAPDAPAAAFQVEVQGDAAVEPDEEFEVVFDQLVNCTLAAGAVSPGATVLNDDAAPATGGGDLTTAAIDAIAEAVRAKLERPSGQIDNVRVALVALAAAAPLLSEVRTELGGEVRDALGDTPVALGGDQAVQLAGAAEDAAAGAAAALGAATPAQVDAALDAALAGVPDAVVARQQATEEWADADLTADELAACTVVTLERVRPGAGVGYQLLYQHPARGLLKISSVLAALPDPADAPAGAAAGAG